MGSSLASFICAVGISGLFYLDRDNSARTSKFLWLPVIWLWINASRPISNWLGVPYESAGQASAGNLIDQLVAGLLILGGIIAIVQRRKIATAVLRSSWPIVLYFSFCLFTLLFSDFPGWGFKRWSRGLGDLVMVMIVVTENEPAAALRLFFSRSAFILFPASVLLVKYYPDLSRYYSPEGLQLIGGVTTNKNILGVGTFLLIMGALWQVLALLNDRKQPNRTRRLLAQCTLLALGLELLVMARSATSGACFALGAFLMLVIPLIRRRTVALHALILVILLAGGIAKLLGIQGEVMKGMGRSSDFTGRTEIWKILQGMDTNPIVGAGFETFWVGPRLEYMNHIFPGINESHNGYLEVWLNLGGIGLSLIVLILGQGYNSAVGAFRRDPLLGGLLVAYIITAVTYNVTEAGFRMLGPEWIFVVLSVVAAGRLRGVDDVPSQSRQELVDPSDQWAIPSPRSEPRISSRVGSAFFSSDMRTTLVRARLDETDQFG
jgi:exopolysaccharide production protein ExoQ